MSVTITIQLSPEAIRLSDKFRNMPQEFPQAIKRGMTRALAVTSGRIQETRLTGKGPFPVEQHQLGERTGQLKLRTRATEAQIDSQGQQVVVSGKIGSSVRYAAVHEFGFTGMVKGKSGKTHMMNIPERAPFRTGITENAQYIADEIEREIMATLKTP